MFISRVKHPFILLFTSFKRMMEEDGLMAAGHMAFTAFLSLFPFLIFLAALAGFLSTEEDIQDIIDLMFRFMPMQVAEAMAPAVSEVISVQPGGLLTVGFIGTFWAASNGIEVLRISLNRAYRVKKKRPIWERRLQSLLFVALSAFLIFFMSLLVLFGPVIWNVAAPIFHLGIFQEIIFDMSRYIFATFALVISLLTLHRFLPHIKQRSITLLPGTIFTAVAFLVSGSLFSAYLANFGNYNVMYGSLGSIVITLIFFYLTALLFIFGAYLNASIFSMRERKE